MAYALPDTRLLGGVPVSDQSELLEFFSDAADEIDIALGFTYETPITFQTDGITPISRQVQLVLARINRYLASGRYILAKAAGGEDNTIHAYGVSLVREALTALGQMLEGNIVLGAKRIGDPSRERQAPKISNIEAQSNVDAFYKAFTHHGDQQIFEDRRREFRGGYIEVVETGDGYLGLDANRGD